MFKKIENENKTNNDNFHSNSKVEIFINDSNIGDMFQSIYTTIITKILLIDHTISVSKYNPLARSSYIK